MHSQVLASLRHGRPTARRILALAALIVLSPSIALHATGAPLEDVVARVKPSIVAIGTYQRMRSPQFLFRGTGFAVGDGTLVATNAHVLPDTLDTAKFETLAVVVPGTGNADPERRDARVATVDKEHDVALIHISGVPLPALSLRDSNAVREGTSAAFTGFPIGTVMGLVPVTHRATVSAITPIAIPTANSRQLDQNLVRRLQHGAFTVLQLDATAYPGSSGSPLYDASTGEVLGIVNMVFVKTTKEAVLSQPSGITFAMPVAVRAEPFGVDEIIYGCTIARYCLDIFLHRTLVTSAASTALDQRRSQSRSTALPRMSESKRPTYNKSCSVVLRCRGAGTRTHIEVRKASTMGKRLARSAGITAASVAAITPIAIDCTMMCREISMVAR